MLDDLKGIVAPFTTPFNEDDTIEFGAIEAQLDWLIAEGVHGVAAGGSTGEGHALSREEYRDLMAETVRGADGRIPVVAGIISNSTGETALRGKLVRDLGVVALQVTPPHYLFKPDDDALVDHFRRIHGECGLPILIYNVVPWCYLSPDLLLRIMDEVPGVAGVKQSPGQAAEPDLLGGRRAPLPFLLPWRTRLDRGDPDGGAGTVAQALGCNAGRRSRDREGPSRTAHAGLGCGRSGQHALALQVRAVAAGRARGRRAAADLARDRRAEGRRAKGAGRLRAARRGDGGGIGDRSSRLSTRWG